MGSKTQKRASPEPLLEGESPDKRARRLGDKTNTHVASDASDAVMAVPSSLPSTKPAECGVITRIHCENFMCHRSFTIDLNRNVNFIYGQNGSGKSAILAAIQICLGAGARRTARARNLKDLVRKDSTAGYAKVRVTLLNQGVDAFHKEVYGDRITIERTIATAGGYNGYKLLDADLKEVSRSKKDLDELLDKVNAQVENPCCILSQEEAKKFLTGKSEDKYAFFMKATELERIDRTIATTTDKIMELQEQERRMLKNLQADEDLMKATKKQYEQHQEISKLQRKLQSLQEAYAWAFYTEKYHELEKQQAVRCYGFCCVQPRFFQFSHIDLSIHRAAKNSAKKLPQSSRNSPRRKLQLKMTARKRIGSEIVSRNSLQKPMRRQISSGRLRLNTRKLVSQSRHWNAKSRSWLRKSRVLIVFSSRRMIDWNKSVKKL